MFIEIFFLVQVHNRNLLSLDFDRITRTEKVYDDHRKFTLRIHYDHAGRPTLWAPSSRLNGVNVTYSPGGHVAGIQRGTMSVRMEYDQNSRITSQIFADGKSWSYTYLEKVCNVFFLIIVGKKKQPNIYVSGAHELSWQQSSTYVKKPLIKTEVIVTFFVN